MTDRAVHQLEAGLNGAPSDFLFALILTQTLDCLIRAELQINAVGLIDGFLRHILADQRRQIAAHLIAQRQLAV